MPDSLTCEDVSSRDLVPQYVSGVVSEMDAEALELHVLGCERCWAELQAARDVRAALLHADAAVVPVTSKRLSDALHAMNWREIYRDDRAAVMVPAGSPVADSR